MTLNNPGPEPISPEALDRFRYLLDPYLDGSLNAGERQEVDHLCATHPACAEELAFAQRIHNGLHALALKPCPDHVTTHVLAHARAERWAARRATLAGWAGDWLRPAWTRLAWRPALALAAVLALALTVSVLRQPAPEPDTYTDAEIEQAMVDAQWTLAYLSEVGQKTGVLVREEVLDERVLTPMRRTVEHAFE